MTRWQQIERRLEPWAFPHLTLLLIAGQLLVYLLEAAQIPAIRAIELLPERVLARGEIWRLVTFLMTPPRGHPIFVFFGWYLFYLMGSALNAQWGALRYNLFILLGWGLTAGLAFATPGQAAPTMFIGGSVFLAFAWLFPDFVLHLFFVIPVKIRWLAWLTWGGYGWMVLTGGRLERMMILASVANVLVFLGREIGQKIRQGGRRMKVQAQAAAGSGPTHRCALCGRDSESHPDLEFRYCRECDPTTCYCGEHVAEHPHYFRETRK